MEQENDSSSLYVSLMRQQEGISEKKNKNTIKGLVGLIYEMRFNELPTRVQQGQLILLQTC